MKNRMLTRDRTINILSGHMGAGKTYLFKFLTALPENQGPQVFVYTKDTVLAKYFSTRTGGSSHDTSQDHMLAIYYRTTPSERLYADELLRVDVGQAILLEDSEKVLLDMSMRSRKKYQEPFVAMVQHTEQWLQLFEADRAQKQELLPPDPAPKIHLRVVLLFSNFEAIRRRMTKRWPHIQGNKLPDPVIETLPNFEIPTAYPFLAIDTSDESPEADEKRKKEIQEFFSGRIPDSAIMADRAEAAKQCLENVKQEIQKFL